MSISLQSWLCVHKCVHNPLSVKHFHKGWPRKPHEHRPNSEIGKVRYKMWRQVGLDEVQVRAAVMALPPGHPYRRLPSQFATSLRRRIIEGRLLTEAELDAAMPACEEIATDANTFIITFIVTQIWGRKSGH